MLNEGEQLFTSRQVEISEAPGNYESYNNQTGEQCESQCDTNATHSGAYRSPNIPGMDGMPMRPPPAIFFIIFCISRN